MITVRANPEHNQISINIQNNTKYNTERTFSSMTNYCTNTTLDIYSLSANDCEILITALNVLKRNINEKLFTK